MLATCWQDVEFHGRKDLLSAATMKEIDTISVNEGVALAYNL